MPFPQTSAVTFLTFNNKYNIHVILTCPCLFLFVTKGTYFSGENCLLLIFIHKSWHFGRHDSTFYTSGIEGLSRKTLVQISMDGANVNLKFKHIMDDVYNINLLEVGSCRLYVISCAFKVGGQ